MTLPPLDYETVGRDSDRSVNFGWVALGLAIAAGAIDGIAFAIGSGDGGRDWAYAAPVVGVSILVATAFAITSACIAVTVLIRHKGRDTLSWLGLLLAAGTACGGMFMIMWTIDAIASV